MTDALETWTEQAWTALASMPWAADVAAAERQRWDAFRHRETLELVVFGAVNAGKSSLLKRLLVDWGVPVPDWLTISGRRQTFEACRIEVQGLGLTDTPGLASGNADHDAITLEALRLADAYVWVLPYQLVTSQEALFRGLLEGEAGIAEATVAVIARMDEVVDPMEDEEGFATFCENKKKELADRLARWSLRDLASVHCVVADPYQMVGRGDATPASYDLGRAWDGIDGLVRTLLALREQRARLRRRAGARFVYRLLADVRDDLEARRDRFAANKEALDNETERHELFAQRVDSLRRQARAELKQRIEEVLLSSSRAGRMGAEAIQALGESLATAVGDWLEESYAAYRKLAAELEVEVRERHASPSMAAFARLAAAAAAEELEGREAAVDALKVAKRALKSTSSFRKAFDEYAASRLGMSLKTAASRLQQLESSGESVAAFIKSQGRRATFRSVEHAAEAQRLVKVSGVLATAAPLVEALGSLVLDIASEARAKKEAEERRARRLRLREQLREEARKLEEAGAADFEAACEGLHRWLAERRSALDEAREALDRQLDEIDAAIRDIARLMETSPL